MRSKIFFPLVLALLSLLSASVFGQVSGVVSSDTTWTKASSPVAVSGTVTVSAGVTLTIEAGTMIQFSPGTGLLVAGAVSAAGTSADTIVLTSSAGVPARGDWNGIEFVNTTDVGSVMDFVKIEYAGGGANQASVFFRTGAYGVALSNMLLRESAYHGINVRASSPPIIDSRIEGIDGFGVFSDLFSNFSLRRSTIRTCTEGGIRVPINAAPSIDSCTIEANGDGIFVANGAAPTITGNVIQNNTRGIYYQFVGITQPVLRDNTIEGNTQFGILHGGSSNLDARYNYWGSEYGPYNEAINPTGRGDTVSSSVLISPWSSSGLLAVTQITSTITSNTVWTAGVYWIKNTISVNSPATLTLQPGVIVKFASGVHVNVNNGASLVVAGTTDSLVVFTSEKDDSYGGDSNGDGEATQPAAGNWNYVRILGGSSISNLILKYSSSGLYLSVAATLDSVFASANGTGLISDATTSLTVTNSVFNGNTTTGMNISGANGYVLNVTNSAFVGNGQHGVYLSNGTISSFTGSKASENGSIGVRGYQSNASGASIFTGNDFSDNGQHGLWYGSAQGSPITVSNNVFENNAQDGLVVTKASIQTNAFNGNRLPIVLMGDVRSSYAGNSFAGNAYAVLGVRSDDSHLYGTLALLTPAGLLPGVYFSQTSTIPAGDTLVVEPGVVVRMNANAYWNIYGRLDAQGAAGDTIIFTSHRDHASGGNIFTSGDATGPQKGDWGYLRFLGAQSTSLVHVKLLYSTNGLYLTASSWQNTIDHLTAWNNSSTALYADNVATFTLDNSSVRYNGTGVSTTNSEVVVRNSVLSDNTQQGLLTNTGAGPKEISNSSIERNGSNGFQADNVTGPLTMVGNTVHQNSGSGVFYKNTTSLRTEVQYIGNIVTNNTQDGIVSSRARFVDNTITGNRYPIGVVGLMGYLYTDNNGVDGNVISGNTYPAISIRGNVGDTLQFLFPQALPTHTYVHPSGSFSDYGTSPLIIEPGVVLKFGKDAYINKYRRVEAVGTPTKPVILTSWRDSTAGGRTNAVSDTVGPAPGDWQYVRFLNGGDAQASSLRHVQIRFGSYTLYISGVAFTNTFSHLAIARSSTNGVYADGGVVALDSVSIDSSGSAGIAINSSATFSVTNSTLRQNGSYGLYASGSSEFEHVTQTIIRGNTHGIYVVDANAPQVLQGNTIAENSGYGVYVTASNAGVDTLLLIDGNTISNNGTGLMSSRAYIVDNVFQGNTFPLGLTEELSLAGTGNANGNFYQGNSFVGNQYDAVSLTGSLFGTLGGSKPDSLPNRLYRYSTTLTLSAGKTLRIEKGSIVKGSGGPNMNVYGTLDIAGTGEERVVLTSWKDDSYGGDSNRDSSASVPVKGDIGYIRLLSSNAATINTIKALTFRYSNNGVSVEQVNQVTIDSSLFANCGIALYRSSTGTTSVTSSDFRDNTYGVQNNAGGSVTVSNSNFEHNTTAAVHQGFNSTIAAVNNYWGAATGPFVNNGPDLNPGGTGDKINVPTGIVNYRPFYTGRSGVLAGDVSENGDISAYDASLTLQHVVGAITLTGLQQAAADVTKDGNVSAFDASLILRYVVGYISGFKSAGTMQTAKSVPPAYVIRTVAASDDAVDLIIEVSGEGIYATEMSIAYPQTDWTVVSVTKGSLSNEFLLAQHSSGGTTKVALAGMVPPGTNGEWVVVSLHRTHAQANASDISVTSFTFNEASSVTSVEEQAVIPTEFALRQNYPNPFNPSTTVSYDVPIQGAITLLIYDMLGRQVATLFEGEQAPGTFRVVWNGASDAGSRVTSGIYFVTMTAKAHDGQTFRSVRKMVLTK